MGPGQGSWGGQVALYLVSFALIDIQVALYLVSFALIDIQVALYLCRLLHFDHETKRIRKPCACSLS
jgi:hypothetical protein